MFKNIRINIILTNFYVNRSLKTSPRVRFAPSPTGFLHLGGLRTALYNFLFAKSKGGSFILRIEDTDQSRKVEGSIEALGEDLEWAGIEVNEGPGLPGRYGPYVQSERLNLYQDHIKILLENGAAYKCFCTERRLDIIRRDALRNQMTPKYDNHCRNLTQADIKDKMDAGKPYCIRFKLSSDCSAFEDLIFGGIAYDVSQNEGDPILMKSDGFPTYHFANVVDDHLMDITHVLRGVEWQISTTKHFLIYKVFYKQSLNKYEYHIAIVLSVEDLHTRLSLSRGDQSGWHYYGCDYFIVAFGWQPPQFGHLPLIVNADGTKLSKRQSDVRVSDYRSKGIFPLALVNYITLTGGGFNHVPGAGVSLKTMGELADEINKISSHPSRLNPDLLEECNRLDIKRQLKHPEHANKLVSHLHKLISHTYKDHNLNVSEEHIRNVLNWSTTRVTRIEDLVSENFRFLWILPKSQNLNVDKNMIESLLKNLEIIEAFEGIYIKNMLKEFSVKNNIKFPVLMKILRSALSGFNEGPSVSEMMHLLGKEQSLKRLRAVVR